MKVLLASVILSLILASSLIVVAYTAYSPSWQYIVDAGSYETLYSWGVEGDPHDEVVYLTVQLNNTASDNLDFGVSAYYLNGSSAWNFTLDVSSRDYVRGCFPDPTSDYLLVVGYLYNTLSGTWDGAVIRVNKTDSSDWKGVYFDTGQHDFLRSVYVGGDGSIYVVGEYYNSTSKKYYGVIGRFDNYSLVSYSWRSISLSNYNLTLYDAVIGSDGYLYVTGHVLYYYYDSNNNRVYYIPIYQLVYKIDPVNLDLVNSTYISLATSQGYVNIVNTMKIDITGCGDGICITGFYYDEENGPTSPTLGAFVEKLDTSFNKLWRRNISTTYHEVFHGISSDVSGNIIVAGKTSNDYGTGLNTSYYHVFVVVFDSAGDLKEAFLAGGDKGDIAYDAAIDLNGGTYISGAQYSTTIDFYNITSDITVSSNPGVGITGSVGNGARVARAIKLPTQSPRQLEPVVSAIGFSKDEYPLVPDTRLYTIHDTIWSVDKILLPSPLKPLQAGSDDNALIVSLGYSVDPLAAPPTPIPEPIVVSMVLAVAFAVAYYYSRRR